MPIRNIPISLYKNSVLPPTSELNTQLTYSNFMYYFPEIN